MQIGILFPQTFGELYEIIENRDILQSIDGPDVSARILDARFLTQDRHESPDTSYIRANHLYLVKLCDFGVQ